ncbi:MAG: NAD(P)/FAD-dependent oxidoreductase [Bacteroidota bacterium]
MKRFEVIVIGGSYAGMAAAMALGRALRKVLVIDDNQPANRQTPFAHNFLTQDGSPPAELRGLAREQVSQYPSIHFHEGRAIAGNKTKNGFVIETNTGESFYAGRLVFATGIKDLFPPIEGITECWGISVLHCPYCHGYEVAGQTTAVLGNGDAGFEFVRLLSNWTKDLTLFTNGPSALSFSQSSLLCKHSIDVVETEIDCLEHTGGKLTHVMFRDGVLQPLQVLYALLPFEQHCSIPMTLGCELTETGYLVIDATFKTTVEGVYACGDNTSRVRTLANAIAMGTTAGMMLNKELVADSFS